MEERGNTELKMEGGHAWMEAKEIWDIGVV